MNLAKNIIITALLSHATFVFGAASCAGVIGNRTGTEDTTSFVPNSYLVMFNDPAIGVERVVLPPDPALIGKVPFPEAGNGQTREQVAQLLSLEGKVTFILDVLNGAVIATDEAEAKRLSCDPRVKSVMQDRYSSVDDSGIPANPAIPFTMEFHTDPFDIRPFYSAETHTLQVPLVDTIDQAGVYQQAELQYDNDGRWRLVSNSVGTLTGNLHTVELLTTDSFPAQIFLRIKGDFPSSCNVQPAPQPVVRQQSNHFSIYLYEEKYDTTNVMCLPKLAPFEITIVMPVYGLEAGVYHYKVNGEFAGSFTLTQPNRL